MIIRSVQETDYEQLVKLYRRFFSTHNIFQRPDDAIIAYLKDQAKTSPLLVAEEKGKLVGAVVLHQFEQNADGSHRLWKLRHFAFLNEDVATKLLQAAEEHVRNASKTAKIELTIAETEPGRPFYFKNGYKQEGVLQNHYRPGEKCYILGKSFV